MAPMMGPMFSMLEKVSKSFHSDRRGVGGGGTRGSKLLLPVQDMHWILLTL